MQYPKSVPILEPGDVGRHYCFYLDGQPCCAVGWLAHVFDIKDPYNSRSTRLAVSRTLYVAVFNLHHQGPIWSDSVVQLNDHEPSSVVRAEMLNYVFAFMGYRTGRRYEQWVRKHKDQIINECRRVRINNRFARSGELLQEIERLASELE